MQFDARGLATILYRFAKLKYVIGSEFIDAWTNKAINLMDEFNAQDLANSIYALGRLEIHPQDEFINAWIHYATKTIKNFNPQGVANSIYALGQLEIHPQDEFINAWIHHATKTIKNFNPQDLANSIYALGQLEIHPQDEFINAWIHHATKTIKNFNPQGLANSIYALGRLEIHPQDEFINAWTNKAINLIDEFNTQDLANSIYGILILNVLCDSKIKVPQLFIDAVNKNIELLDENNENISQILKAHYYFSKQGVGILTSQNRQLLEKKFKTKLIPYHTSNLQLNVLKVVKKVLAAHTVKSEHYIKQITSSVDIFIKDQNTVIQVDGPCHFDNNNVPNILTRLNTQLLKSYGYIVHRIPYWIWDKLRINTDKEKYICELICDDQPVSESEISEEIFYDAQENIPDQSTSEVLPHSELQIPDDVFYDAYEYSRLQ
ncbi:RAP domain-containing protein [Orientia tsutsugamushi]|uniref:RAP domain-containing protein n=1 Tax=Orientia tsutsugamushi TaxID=784 RepID=UPI00315D25F8